MANQRSIVVAFRLGALLVPTIIILMGACKKNDSNAANGAPSAVANAPKPGIVGAIEGFIVKPVALTSGVTASGSLIPSEETALHPEASGRVISINLPEGKTVQKGDLLLKIFDQDLQTQLLKLQTQLKTAEITEQRLGELLKVKGISQQEYDLALLAVQNLKNEMELVRINISKTELRAPYSGIIGLRNISPGAYVTPANSVATIRSGAALKLDFSVPEKYATLIRQGQDVFFSVEGTTEKYAASIIATEQRISEASRNLAVRALVKGNQRGLLPGQFAEVSLALGGKSQALMIPSQALIPQARDKKVYLSKNGKATFITVKTGVRQAEMVEITEGLSAGDTVAVTGILFLKPDSPMKFAKVD